MNDGMRDLEVEKLLVNVQGATCRRIDGTSRFFELSSYNGQRVLVSNDDGAFDYIDVNREEFEEGWYVGFLGI